MTATEPQPAEQTHAEPGWAALRAKSAAQLKYFDELIADYERHVLAALADPAANAEILEQAQVIIGRAMRIAGNGLANHADAMRNAAIAEGITAGQLSREYERGYAAGLEAGSARHRKPRDGRAPLSVVRDTGMGGVAAGALRAVSRHSVPAKRTAGVAVGAATVSLGAGGLRHLDNETRWMPPLPNHATLAPASAVPVSSSSSVPFQGAPAGRHSSPYERQRVLVLAMPAPAVVPSPSWSWTPPASSDSGTSGSDGSMQSATWQGDGSQDGGSQSGWSGSQDNRTGWQDQGTRQAQGNQWGHGDHQDNWNQQAQRGQWGFQGGQGGFQQHDSGGWTYRDDSGQGGGWQQGGQGHGDGHGGGNGHGW